MALNVDFYTFALVGVTAVLLLMSGIKLHYLGALGGLLLFFLFAYMIAFQANLCDPSGFAVAGACNAVMLNFALSTSNFMWGAYGLFGAIFGLAMAIILK